VLPPSFYPQKAVLQSRNSIWTVQEINQKQPSTPLNRRFADMQLPAKQVRADFIGAMFWPESCQSGFEFTQQLELLCSGSVHEHVERIVELRFVFHADIFRQGGFPPKFSDQWKELIAKC
jgi:hypothetical protein